MICGASAADGLHSRTGADGSFSLWSERFGEGFHGAIGARREAREKFVRPAGLGNWHAGSTLTVVDVGVGLGTNTAALLSAAIDRGLQLRWWGLEIDRRPLERALAEPVFRRQWPAQALELLRQLAATGHWRCGAGSGALLWGDARQRLPELLEQQRGQCDLVLLDAFSPQRCPELWSEDVLVRLAALLAPRGRLLTYCSAAAVRQSLRRAGLEVMAITPPADNGSAPACWSLGTAASPSPLCDGDGVLRPLSAMEREHLATRAAEPYRDPSGAATAEEILSARRRAQSVSTAASTRAWRRRWGLEHGSGGTAWQPA